VLVGVVLATSKGRAMTNGKVVPLRPNPSNSDRTKAAILAAASEWRASGLPPQVLLDAVRALEGPFAYYAARELRNLNPGTKLERDERMRRLLIEDVETVIREASR
jgi:hypothetical protein